MDHENQASAAAKPKQGKIHALVVAALHNPVQLRMLSMAVIFGGWYLGVSSPLSEGIGSATREVAIEKTRLGLANDVEKLRTQVARFQKRLPAKTDANEWVQYMIAGLRETPLHLIGLDTDGTKDVGPFKAVVVKVQIEGTFEDVDRFLRWIETNERLLRIDSVKIAPGKNPPEMNANLIVLGVMG